jgi:hypothetical protein
MKPYLLSFLFPSLILCQALAPKSFSIPVINPGFETDVQTCSGDPCYVAGITGWLAGPVSGTFRPGPLQYPAGVPGGLNVAGIGNFSSSGSIMQTTGVTLRPATTYVLKLSIGQRLDYSMTGYVASLMAGGFVLASDSSLRPEAGTFLTDTIVFQSAPQNAALQGLPLQIIVTSVGNGEVDVDNVTLTATTN